MRKALHTNRTSTEQKRHAANDLGCGGAGDTGGLRRQPVRPSGRLEGQIRMDWNEMFEIEVFPVVTAEQGMEMARQAMSS